MKSILVRTAGAAASLLVAVALPLTANALTSETVYDAIPAALPANMASLGFQATQTAEFGDYVHLGGANRALESVTVTMSNWALQSTPANVTFCSNNPTKCSSTGFLWPITVKIYANTLTGGVPNTVLATKTTEIEIPWRPEADPTCATPTAWRNPGDGLCYNGYAFNATFDLSDLNVALPEDVIIGISYNTQTYGSSPAGVDGPYNSLNVGVESSIAVGTDDNSDNVFWNTSTAAWYTDGGTGGVGTFRQDTNWGSQGTIPLRITATEFPVVNETTNDGYFTIQAAVDGANAGDVIKVSDGLYIENVTVNKAVSIVGQSASSTMVSGQFSLTVASTSISGFDITNPSGNFGVFINGVGSVSVTGNYIHDIGTSNPAGNVYGVYFQDHNTNDASGITIQNNTITNIGSNSSVASNGGIGIGDSTGESDITNVVISGNTVTNVLANNTGTFPPGRGAYGILLNHADNTPSTDNGTVSAQITNNTVCGISGYWAHAIGLEGNTPSTTVSGNTICDVTGTKTPNDAFGIYVENNTSATSSTLVIESNTITNSEGGIRNTAITDAACSLVVSPTSITSGGSATLSWSCTNTSGAVSIDNGVGTQGPVGSTSVSPSNDTTYTLTTTAHGTTTPVTATATLDVTFPTSGGGGGGGGNGPIFVGSTGGGSVLGASVGPTGSSVPTTGQVLGASTYNFTRNLTIGSTGTDVTELQKLLISLGYDIPAITKGGVAYGYFGTQTRDAVAAYQRANNITPTAGYFGPLTRAKINAGTGMTEAQKAALLASLYAQLADLQAKLKAMGY